MKGDVEIEDDAQGKACKEVGRGKKREKKRKKNGGREGGVEGGSMEG